MTAPQDMKTPAIKTDDPFDIMANDVLGPDHDFALEGSIGKIFLAELQASRSIDIIPTKTSSTFTSSYEAPQEQTNDKYQQSEEDNSVEDQKPKRSLSAYNFFFQAERQNLLRVLPDRRKQGKRKPRNSHGKIGFSEMARTIASKWKSISADEKAPYDEMAKRDMVRYKSEMTAWKSKLAAKVSNVSLDNAHAYQGTPTDGYQSGFSSQANEHLDHVSRAVSHEVFPSSWVFSA